MPGAPHGAISFEVAPGPGNPGPAERIHLIGMPKPARVPRLAALHAALVALAAPAAGQAPAPLWFDLVPGPHPVGFEARYEIDTSRDFAGPGSGRPVRVFFWYPAAPEARRQAQLTWGDYLDPAVRPSPTGLAREVGAFLLERETDTARRQFSPLDEALFERLLELPVAARDAPGWADGPHPLLLHSLGLGDFQQESTVLWEYLASHGYVVAVVPQLGPSASDAGLGFDAAHLAVQVTDLEFALGAIEAAGLPVDLSGIGVIGHSAGGMAAFMLAEREPRVTAIVGLEGSFSTADGAAILSALDYPFEELGAAILDARVALKRDLDTTALESSVKAERFVARIGGEAPPAIATHFDFQNWPLYGALLGVEDDRGAPARSLEAGREFFLAAIRITRIFLDHALRADPASLAILDGSVPLPGIDPAWIAIARFR